MDVCDRVRRFTAMDVGRLDDLAWLEVHSH